MSCYKCTKRNYPYCYETCEDYLAEKKTREQRKKELRKDYVYNQYTLERAKRVEKIINNRKKS